MDFFAYRARRLRLRLKRKIKYDYYDYYYYYYYYYRKFLGDFSGKREDIESWLQKKVEQWYMCVQHLAHAAKSFPHEAYTALSKSLQMNGDTYFE